MKTEVKKLDGIKRQISVEVTGDIVKNKFEDVFKKINQTAKVPGFRPGNIPRDILEKKFSAQAHELVLEELLPELYNKAVESESLEAVGSPKISDVKIDRANLSFKAEIEVAPEISLKKYRGITVNYKKIEVPLDEIKRNIDTLKEQKKIENVDDTLAKGLGYPNLAALEKFVETQLFIQKQNQERRRIEDEIIDTILKDLDFGIPQVMVDRHLQELIRQVKLDMAIKGVPREKIEEQEKALSNDLAPEARKQVKVYLVLAEIARKENIVKDEHLPAKVMEFLLKEAEWKEAK